MSKVVTKKAAPEHKGKGQRIVQIMLVALGIVMLLGIVSQLYRAIAEGSDNSKYLAPGKLVDIGGYKLHINCTGEGSPTVVLDSGVGEFDLAWTKVQPEIAKTNRVCSYDRAGLGWSENGEQPRTTEQMVKELHNLLAAANVKKPYVLVGHSLGGLNAQLYAHNYPEEVAGVVLVDSAHPEQDIRLPSAILKTEEDDLTGAAFCKVFAPFGIIRLGGELGLISAADLGLKYYPTEVLPEAKAMIYKTLYCTTTYSELSAFRQSQNLVKDANVSLGNKPLVVLSATAGHYSGPSAAQGEQVWNELQASLLKLSTNSTQVIASESHHAIQLEQPQLVIDAIKQVAQKVQS